MKIGGLQKLTLIDYPQKPACTVFLSGCNFRCPWCYSSTLVLPEKIKESPEIRKEYFFDFLSQRKNVLEGVCICGGEPTIHAELFDFVKEIVDLGYLVKLDTNGTNPKAIKNLLENNLLDYVAMDIKAPLTSYKKATGVDVSEAVLKESISLIKEMENYEFRTTVLPDIHQKKDLIAMAKSIKGAKNYFLQRFKNDSTIDASFQTKTFDEDVLFKVFEEIKPLFENCKIR